VLFIITNAIGLTAAGGDGPDRIAGVSKIKMDNIIRAYDIGRAVDRAVLLPVPNG
jgi:hypothetical protein